jgi:hypothetical protein
MQEVIYEVDTQLCVRCFPQTHILLHLVLSLCLTLKLLGPLFNYLDRFSHHLAAVLRAGSFEPAM